MSTNYTTATGSAFHRGDEVVLLPPRVTERSGTSRKQPPESLAAFDRERGKELMPAPGQPVPMLTGTEAQVEWAERIRGSVMEEFQRVEKSFRSVAGRQDAGGRMRTEAILTILRDKRDDAMSHSDAGYFIKEWQEISDQVRQAIGKDPRFQALNGKRTKAESS